MSTAFVRLEETHFPQTLRLLRSQVALVRALLDEIDRLAPMSDRESLAQKSVALGARLTEEYGRLAARILECAVTLTGKDDAGSGPGE